ncbi:MAG: FG-GAP repeat domain-containing protein [Phycisphaerae bacterium]
MAGKTLVVVIVLGLGAGIARGFPLPGTLNFRDATSIRINQTVSETSTNEKALDVGDFDNDGDLDVVVAAALSDFGERLNKLYRNDNGVFNEVSGAPIIPGFSATDVSRITFMRDFDGDGWLDIYVINDSNAGFGPGSDRLYINNHPGGVFSSFVDESTARLPSNGLLGASCNGAAEDFDQDGDYDVYAGNYPNTPQDRLVLNNGSGFFTDATSLMVPTSGDYTVHIDAADMNGDAKLDLLVSNNFGQNKIYYNDNGVGSSGAGDFNYPGSVQTIGDAVVDENTMVAGDFDSDGDMDIYWANFAGGGGDRILRNNGNDAANKATFTTLPAATLPPSVTQRISRKVTVADLNADGRPDIFVGKESGVPPGGIGGRPSVLRNTSVNGMTSFVDWTPPRAFPTGNTNEGWQAVIFDTDGDGDLDIFLGAFVNDHLFEQVPVAERNESQLVGGVIPAVFNNNPVAIVGTATPGQPDTFSLSLSAAGGFMALILNGPDDYLLEVLDTNMNLLASSDRGGLGVEEALQHSADNVTRLIRVSVLQVGSTPVPGDLNCDAAVDPADIAPFALALTDPAGYAAAFPNCPVGNADTSGDGLVDGRDLAPFVGLLLNGAPPPAPSTYALEVLARN